MSKTAVKPPPYYLVRLGTLIEQFQNEAAHFTQMMLAGAGIRSNGLLNTIRKLEDTYLQISCHLDFSKAVIGRGCSLDDALDALEEVRTLEQAEAEKHN